MTSKSQLYGIIIMICIRKHSENVLTKPRIPTDIRAIYKGVLDPLVSPQLGYRREGNSEVIQSTKTGPAIPENF
jgi:hypothetical protein